MVQELAPIDPSDSVFAVAVVFDTGITARAVFGNAIGKDMVAYALPLVIVAVVHCKIPTPSILRYPLDAIDAAKGPNVAGIDNMADPSLVYHTVPLLVIVSVCPAETVTDV